jgi:protein-disulfide isomerase
MKSCIFIAMALIAQFTTEQKEEIQSIVREYLIGNPEVLVEVGQAFQKKQQEQVQSKVSEKFSTHKDELFNRKGPFLGNEEGNLTIVEFVDYQCPHCQAMNPIVEDLVEGNSDLRVIIIPLPFMGPNSVFASKAALAAQKQGLFKEMHDALMKNREPLSSEKILAIAKSVGLDTKKLEKDMEFLNMQVSQNAQLAKTLGIQRTPTFIVAPSRPTTDSKLQIVSGQVEKPVLESAIKAAGNN